ncbi:MAG TPA: hypothetical protein VNS81_06560 [Nocardioides sp.]|nr:hypothetical protein [Nocardioides sp.]
MPIPSVDQPPAYTVTVEEAIAYLAGSGGTFNETTVGEALAAEARDQANRCRLPKDDAGDAFLDDALREALLRRVAHNLAVRKLPLGVQATLTDIGMATSYVGGTDAEVKRLEAPYRKRVVA